MMALKPDTRLMVISALGDADTAIEAVERGANEYVIKPFSTRTSTWRSATWSGTEREER